MCLDAGKKTIYIMQCINIYYYMNVINLKGFAKYSSPFMHLLAFFFETTAKIFLMSSAYIFPSIFVGKVTTFWLLDKIFTTAFVLMWKWLLCIFYHLMCYEGSPLTTIFNNMFWFSENLVQRSLFTQLLNLRFTSYFFSEKIFYWWEENRGCKYILYILLTTIQAWKWELRILLTYIRFVSTRIGVRVLKK